MLKEYALLFGSMLFSPAVHNPTDSNISQAPHQPGTSPAFERHTKQSQYVILPSKWEKINTNSN